MQAGGRAATSGRRRRAGVPEEREEIARGVPRDLLDRNAAQARYFLGDVLHVAGLVGLAAERHGREVRRVGLDQHPLHRHEPRAFLDGVRVLEGDDAGKGNVEAQVDRAAGDVPGLGEAVHHAARLAGALLGHEAQRVLGGFARVDHQRLAALLRRADVPAEALALPVERFLQAVVVEPGLADRDHPGMVREPQQFIDRGLMVVRLFVRMHARRAPDVRLAFRDRPHRGKGLERGADRQRMADRVGAHVRQDRGHVRLQFREIEVAVGVDEHSPILPAPLHWISQWRREPALRGHVAGISLSRCVNMQGTRGRGGQWKSAPRYFYWIPVFYLPA